MLKNIRFKSLLKAVFALGLVFTLVFGQADSALAARGGGRIGGGSFRMPRTTAPAPRTRAPGGYGGYGGGFGFPFLLPIFGFGGFGGIFGLLLFIGVANFLVRALGSIANRDDGEDYGYSSSSNPPVSVAKLQVGLLADARSLQADLNRIAETADTGTSEGLAQLLQESTLSLLRHPDYWVYAAVDQNQTRLISAEQEFNRLTLAERSKFSEETLSNVNSRLQKSAVKADLTGDGQGQPGEYIVATLVVATYGKVNLPTIQDSQDLRRALSQLGAIASDQLIAIEVLWTPQRTGETLTADEMIAEYPQLTLV
ncbi:hypothetical protein C7271_03240 [filamentous cyanobacterium CCP5]|nr:hypothetical protein C7271_03240 [filamentous cyanobacterium CCP5]